MRIKLNSERKANQQKGQARQRLPPLIPLAIGGRCGFSNAPQPADRFTRKRASA
jgi:hypothetical protein